MTYTSKYITCVLGWLKTWKLECSNESSGQHTASEGASHARQATGLADIAGAGRWVSSESIPTENPRRFHYLEQGDFQENFSSFNNTFLYICTRVTTVLRYEYRHLMGGVSAVCSVYATSYHSWYPLLLALMVFDEAGIHNDPEFQIYYGI